MDANFTPRPDVHPYRSSAHPCAKASRPCDFALAGPILGVTGLLLGLCLLRVACGLRDEGWIFERWVALTMALFLGRSVYRQVGALRRRG